MMSISPEQLSRVIAEIYAAVGSPDSFGPVLRRIRGLVNGSSGMLFTPFLRPSQGGFGFVDHFDAGLYDKYCAEYRDRDPWARAAVRKNLVRTGVTATDEMLISMSDLQKEAFYHDVHVPLDVLRVCSSIVTAGEDSSLPFTYLSIFRGVGARPFAEEERQALELLAPHVLQALRLAYRLAFAESGLASAQDALHQLECGVVLVDAEKRIVFMNRGAERLCTRASGLQALKRCGSECVLKASLGREDVALQRAIESALSVAVAGTHLAPGMRSASVAIHRLHGGGFLLVTALPLPCRLRQAGSSGQALVLVEDPAEKHQNGDHLLSAVFGFTPAECRVARSLLDGEQPKAVAGRLSVSENTVRTHIRALYDKTGTRGMPALMMLLSRVAETRASGS